MKVKREMVNTENKVGKEESLTCRGNSREAGLYYRKLQIADSRDA